MNWLILSAALQLGIAQGAPVLYENAAFSPVDFPPAYATFEVRAETGPVFIETFVRTDMQALAFTDWLPNQVTYQVGAGVELGPLTAGWKHTCYHPVAVFMTMSGYDLFPASEGGTDDFYLRIEIKGGH